MTEGLDAKVRFLTHCIQRCKYGMEEYIEKPNARLAFRREFISYLGQLAGYDPKRAIEEMNYLKNFDRAVRQRGNA